MGISGTRLAIVRTLDGNEVIAADRLGADIGQSVVVANGSRVRDIVYDNATPIKTVVVGIVDEVSS